MTNNKIRDSIPSPLLGKDLAEYFKDHTRDLGFRGMHLVTKNLYVFKKVERHGTNGTQRCIANLIIPVGSTINVSSDYARNHPNVSLRKMRASCAKVKSIFTCLTGKEVFSASSLYYPSFVYVSGETILPGQFFMNYGTCAGGIHFFLNLHDAYYYP